MAVPDARRDLEALPAPRDPDLKATIGTLVQLYVAWRRHDRAAAYRALLRS